MADLLTIAAAVKTAYERKQQAIYDYKSLLASISAAKLPIDRYGVVGYLTPNGDFEEN